MIAVPERKLYSDKQSSTKKNGPLRKNCLGYVNEIMEKYQCCICKDTVSAESRSSPLDPCALVLVSNIDQPPDNQTEQEFFCHFECFRKLVNNDGIMYIMELAAPTPDEIERGEEN